MRFISYCWNIGTTSFRVKDINVKIEEQLAMLSELKEQYPDESWQNLEVGYYDIMLKHGFVKGISNAKEKVARQKTSGLVEMGLLTSNREITQVGNKILQMVEHKQYESHNPFQISEDSFLYLKQLLKYQTTGGSKMFRVKPFIVLLKLLVELEYLTMDEFTYFLPLCTGMEQIPTTIQSIRSYRSQQLSMDEMMNQKILSMDNYVECLDYMLNHDMTDVDEFAKVEMNRKGSRYSKAYCDFYMVLATCFEQQSVSEDQAKVVLDFLKNEYKKNNKTGKVWREYFGYNRNIKLHQLQENLMNTSLLKAKTVVAFQKEFFLLMTRVRWKATLHDYFDLNRRYFSLTDILLFQENKVELDLFPKYYFKQIDKDLLKMPFYDEGEYATRMETDLPLEKIGACFSVNLSIIYDSMAKDYPDFLKNQDNINVLLQQKKQKRFDDLIDREFSSRQLIELFRYYQQEKSDAILQYTDWAATTPAIFEYLLAIAWYRVSEKKGNILDFMRLSLDANLYPKSHASGGDADCLCSYNEGVRYPKHAILLEATLTKSTNQRKSEMEPVSRHLMRYLQEHDETESYALFFAPYLNEEVLSDFRNKKTYQFRGKNGTVQQGLKIMALDIDDMIFILQHNITYEQLYDIFDRAFKDTVVNDLDWYQEQIRVPIREKVGFIH